MTTEEINASVEKMFREVDKITSQPQQQFDDWALQQTMQASEQACMDLLNTNNMMNML